MGQSIPPNAPRVAPSLEVTGTTAADPGKVDQKREPERRRGLAATRPRGVSPDLRSRLRRDLVAALRDTGNSDAEPAEPMNAASRRKGAADGQR